ncbi:MAG: HAMP domain-containing protein [Candidatus Cloacimonetes bacterium]|nr:HAMP domain-containing protein [Candidatus Cloacimonadota bacterium]
MKNIGMSTRIIILFLVVSIGGLVALNMLFQKNNDNSQKILDTMELSAQMRELDFKSEKDLRAAENIMKNHDAAKARLSMALSSSRIVSSVVLLLIILLSTGIFIVVILRISKPLAELKNATEQIRKGNFSVHLPENGISDMKELKASFNLMSRELETIQTRLLLAEKEMIWKDLSRILAHEIKNPLTPIQLVAQRLEERMESDPKKVCDILPESISIISQEIENLRLLAQDFSNYAKVSQPSKEELLPATLIQEIVKSYSQNYHINLDLADDMNILFDKTHFYQIITNILQNAIDASGEEGQIKIRLYGERSYVVISIEDEGMGIHSKDLARIFEPYFSRKSKGTGLGLALVKKLCDANGAVIRVKSKPNEGSTFTLIIEGNNQ